MRGFVPLFRLANFSKIPPIPLNQYKHRLCKLVAALSLLGAGGFAFLLGGAYSFPWVSFG